MREKNCVFCKIIHGELAGEIIEESDNFMAILDAHPAVDGHTLIIPKKHLVTLFDIPDKYGTEFLHFTKKIANKMLEEKKGDGFNLVMNNLAVAGQVVMHAHLHIIPRKEDDGLDLRMKRKDTV